MIAAGEAGVDPDLRRQSRADFTENDAKLEKKGLDAMIYPGVVISIAIGVVSMIMIFVIPKFKDIFKDFGAELPPITKLLLAISEWFGPGYGWAYVIGFPFFMFFMLRLIKMSEGGR